MRVVINEFEFELLTFSGDEEVSVGYNFTVLFTGSKLEKCINEVISISIGDGYWSGVIYYYEFIENTIDNKYKYLCKFYSQLQHYGKYPICKIYTNVHVHELISQALASIKVEFTIIGVSNKYYPYYYQYNQSTHDLLKYIASVNQILFYHNKNHLIIELNQPSEYVLDEHLLELVNSGPQLNTSIINKLQIVYSDAPSNAEVYTFDIDNPNIDALQNKPNDVNRNLIIYSSVKYNQSTAYNKSITSKYPTYKTVTINPMIRHGSQIKLISTSNIVNGQYFILKISHEFVNFIYKNSCNMIDLSDKAYIHSEVQSLTTGPQIATVTGPNHIMNSKIKVRFPWDKLGQNSIYIPILQSLCGNGWGTIVLPSIDQSILVLFECNDPNRPFIAGAFYDGAHLEPINTELYPNDVLIKTKSSSSDNGHLCLLSDEACNARIEVTSCGNFLCESDGRFQITVNNEDFQTLIKSGSNNIQILKGDHIIAIEEGNIVNKINIGNININIEQGICRIEVPEIILSTSSLLIEAKELQFNSENINFGVNDTLNFTSNKIKIISNHDLIIESNKQVKIVAPKINLGSQDLQLKD